MLYHVFKFRTIYGISWAEDVCEKAINISTTLVNRGFEGLRLNKYDRTTKKLCESASAYIILAPERWQSGRTRRSWKPLTVKGPGVRIPLSPLEHKKGIYMMLFFYVPEIPYGCIAKGCKSQAHHMWILYINSLFAVRGKHGGNKHHRPRKQAKPIQV